METMMVKYASQLELIKYEQDFNRIRAIKHFFQLMDFENDFIPKQENQLGEKFSRAKAITAYCKLRSIGERNFYRFIVSYREYGIVGLLPKYGKGGPRADKHKVLATISIDTRAPLKCLNTIRNIINKCWLVKPNIKKTSLSILDRYFNGLIFGSPMTLTEPLSDEEIRVLRRYKASTHRTHSKKAKVILMANDGKTLVEIMESTHKAVRTIFRWISNFNRDHLDSIKIRVNAPGREKIKAERQTRVIDILHKLPSLYDINRTSWTLGAISDAYEKEYKTPISHAQIHAVIRNARYSWRHARMVLTSPDPEYKEKVKRILETLQGLKEGDCFFFIDEVGPYRVKKYGGQRLSLKDQVEIIPANQRGRGKIQFIAALEAVTNQLTWRFTSDKSAFSMIAFFTDLVASHNDCLNIYVTWDAMSVHNSKVVTEWITAHNNTAKTPYIEVVPLPSKSQFLNVIEAVFGGMKKAVICNSDYATPRDMQEAIARHFEERNQFYKVNPKRAGNKIWDMQKFDFDRLPGGLFKKM